MQHRMGRKKTSSTLSRGRPTKKHGAVALASQRGTTVTSSQPESAPITLEVPQSQPLAGHPPSNLPVGECVSRTEPLEESSSTESGLGDRVVTPLQPRKRKNSNVISPDVTISHRCNKIFKEQTNDCRGFVGSQPERSGKKTPSDDEDETESFNRSGSDLSQPLLPTDESASGDSSRSQSDEPAREYNLRSSSSHFKGGPSGADTAQINRLAAQPAETLPDLSAYLDKGPARRIPKLSAQKKNTGRKLKKATTAAYESVPSSSSQINADEEIQGYDEEDNNQVSAIDDFYDCENPNDDSDVAKMDSIEPSSGDGNDLGNSVNNESESAELDNKEVDADGVLENSVGAEFSNGEEELNDDEGVQEDPDVDTGKRRCYII